MSPEEMIWRGRTSLTQPFRRATPASSFPPRWKDDSWNALLHALVSTQSDQLSADAARIAEGNLDLWGRPVAIDLRRTHWGSDPFSGLRLRVRGRRWQHDPKPLWELHRQQHLFPLAAGASAAGRDDWRRLAVDHLLDWIARNPRRPGPAWTSGYETSHRLVGWAFSVPFLVDAMGPQEVTRVNAAFAAQAAYVADRPSRFSSANNHRLAELVGLLAASVVGFRNSSWRALWNELEQEVVRQTYEDGGSREQAAGYFLYVLEILWCAGLVAAGRGEDLGRIEERLRAMLQWLATVGQVDLEPPAMGDDAEDRLLRPDYFERRRARAIAGRVRALLDGSPTLTPLSLKPEERSKVFLESGYAVLRSPDVRVIFDIGELGFGSLAAHGHADALSVLVDRGAQPLLRDSGTGAYAPIEVREAFKNTPAHNTVSVDGLSQAESRGPHLWGRRFRVDIHACELGPEVDYVRAAHDGYRRTRSRAIHTRALAFLKPAALLVLDRVRAERSCDATLMWQYPPDAGPASLEVEARPAARRAAGKGPFSARYTWIDEAPQCTWTTSGHEILFVTAIALGEGAAHISALVHENGVTRVELLTPHRIVITEDWISPTPKIEI